MRHPRWHDDDITLFEYVKRNNRDTGEALVGVELSSAALKLGTPDPQEEKEGHADIDGGFEFTCVDATKATFIDVTLFDFARLQRLEVQVAAPRGQFKRDLKRPANRIALTK